MNSVKMRVLFLLAGLLVFPTATKAALLESPEHIQVISINGYKQPVQLMIRSRSYDLPTGVVNLKVKYRDLIESDDDDSHDTVKSEEVELHFQVSDESKQPYRLQANRPDNLEEAYHFAVKPTIQIIQGEVLIPQLKATYVTDTKPDSSAPAQKSKLPPTDSKAAEMLEYWWQQASDETRAAFLKKVAE